MIAPDEAEAKECIAIAYPDASEIFVGIAFDEMIWPTDWPEERAGKKILGARKYPPEGPTIHPEY